MNYKFKIGERVRIRDWDELIAEYGEKEYDEDRPNLIGVISEMKGYCGCEYTIESCNMRVRNDVAFPVYFLENAGDMSGLYWDERFFELPEPSINVTLTLQELRILLNVKED